MADLLHGVCRALRFRQWAAVGRGTLSIRTGALPRCGELHGEGAVSLIELLALNLAVTLVLMTLLWIVSVILRDVSIVDVFWGPGFVVLAAITFFLTAHSA